MSNYLFEYFLINTKGEVTRFTIQSHQQFCILIDDKIVSLLGKKYNTGIYFKHDNSSAFSLPG